MARRNFLASSILIKVFVHKAPSIKHLHNTFRYERRLISSVQHFPVPSGRHHRAETRNGVTRRVALNRGVRKSIADRFTVYHLGRVVF